MKPILSLIFFISIITITILPGCDDSVSSHSSGTTNKLLGTWITDSITLDDSLLLDYNVQTASFMKFNETNVKTYSYIDTVDSQDIKYTYTSDSIFIEDDEPAKYELNGSLLIFHIDLEGQDAKIYLSKYSGKIPPDEWFEISNNDPQLTNTAWLADSVESDGTMIETDSDFNFLLDFKDETFTQYMLVWGDIDTATTRYTTENGKIMILGTQYAIYKVDNNQLTLTISANGITVIYYLTKYDGPILPNDWRKLESNTIPKSKQSLFIPALLKLRKY